MRSRKRLLPLIAGLSVLALLATPWIEQATSTGEPAPAVGTPRQGEIARYAAEGPEPADLVFRWVGTEPRTDRWGLEREAVLLHVLIRNDTAELPLEFAFHPEGVRPLSITYHATGNGTDAGDGIFGLFQADYAWSSGSRMYPEVDGPALACMFRAGWQGETLENLDGRPVPELCPALTGGDGSALQAAGTREVKGATAYGFRLPGELGGSVAELWFVPGIPYPVEATLTAMQPGRFFLTGWEPGDGETLDPATPRTDARTERPGARFGEPSRWGVVEQTPSPFPFPAREAVAGLTGNPALVDFHAYLRGHPDARVVEFFYTHQGEASPTWRFLFADPQGEGWEIEARRATRTNPQEGLLPEGFGVVSDGGRAVRVDPIAPEAFPERLLALNDAVDAWRTADPAGLELNMAWGLLAQADVPPRLWVGHMSAEFEPSADGLPSRPVKGAASISVLTLNGENGAALMEGRMDLAYDMGISALAGDAPSGWRAPAGDLSHRAAALADLLLPAAAGATVLALLAYYLGGPLMRVVGVPLFHRLERGRVLDHPRRRALLQAIQREPGVHANALAETLGFGNGATLYHLEVLRREGYVTRLKSEGYARYFAPGEMARDEMRRHATLLSGSLHRVLDVVEEHPGLPQAEVARRLGVSGAAVSFAVRRLEREGFLRREREGRTVRLYAAPPEATARR